MRQVLSDAEKLNINISAYLATLTKTWSVKIKMH
jgi:hypothetical protein